MRKIAVSGASGLIGTALVSALRDRGDHVVGIGRVARAPDDVVWDPARSMLDGRSLEGFDAVVHLAGEPIDGRWTRAKKARILESRVTTTRLLATTLSRLQSPPTVVVSASAIGIYGHRGDEYLSEDSEPGQGFLADVCLQWESAAAAFATPLTRLAVARTGVVLTPLGGALKKLLLPIRLGLGGPMGGGKQWWSWITLDDHIRAILHLLDTEVEGPVNLVSPNPLQNRDLTQEVARALGRSAFIPVPAVVLRLALGEMAEDLLLASCRLRPQRLEESGFRFGDPDIAVALADMFNRSS
tara:strand:- start:1408 stop:2304 length:897 start_codon:yes stop_codon:yes gene_type:complete